MFEKRAFMWQSVRFFEQLQRVCVCLSQQDIFRATFRYLNKGKIVVKSTHFCNSSNSLNFGELSRIITEFHLLSSTHIRVTIGVKIVWICGQAA